MQNLPAALAALVADARAANASRAAAETCLRTLDLTSLNDTDTPAVIDALVAKADHGPLGHVAALCVYPQFLTQVFNAVKDTGIARATVINFPGGAGTASQTAADVKASIASGANEIDIVLDYAGFLAGDAKTAGALLRACRDACGPDVKMKVILESAAFDDASALAAASKLALDCGADFLKTSTGKSAKGGATLEAAAVLLQAVKDAGGTAGVKISGGVKTVRDGAQYIALAESVMGKGWITPAVFRIGASGVLTDILQTLGKAGAAPAAASGY